MKKMRWEIWVGIVLLALFVALYVVHYLIFKDVHHIFIYMLGDIAFLPLEVLLVTLIIHKMLTAKEKRGVLEKLNMVIEVFFNEVGTKLIQKFAEFDDKIDSVRKYLIPQDVWLLKDFRQAKKNVKNYEGIIDSKHYDLESLRVFLVERRDFLLRLLENPILLEHQLFTDVLWAVFHLVDELEHRDDVRNLPDTDYDHLSGDMKRAYTRLIGGWLDYMWHLKKSYPYLFSLAVRINPFDLNAEVAVK